MQTFSQNFIINNPTILSTIIIQLILSYENLFFIAKLTESYILEYLKVELEAVQVSNPLGSYMQVFTVLAVTTEEISGEWDKRFEELLTKQVHGRMYILSACKYYGFSTQQLDLLFQSLKMRLDSTFNNCHFTFALEIWRGASQSKFISQIDRFINRAYRN